MALQLAQPVVYQVSSEHLFLYAEAQLAGIVTRLNADGSVRLMLFPPEGAPVMVDNVPEGIGPGFVQIPAASS